MKLLKSLTVLLALASTSVFAAAGPSGEAIGPVTQAAPSATAAFGSLDYTGLSGTCDANSFALTANAAVSFQGNVTVSGATTLNGTAYDTYSFGLPSPSAFGTGFGRTFSPALASSTYTFVFVSTVSLAGEVQGATTVTVRCNAGALTATSVWNAVPARTVPTGSPALYGLIALLLAGMAGAVLRRRY